MMLEHIATWQRADLLALLALLVTVVGVLVTIVGVMVACWTLRCSNLNTSVATANSLTSDIQTALSEYIDSVKLLDPTEERRTTMARKLEALMNRLEMASAVCVEKSLYGISLTLIRDYVRGVLNILLRNEYVCEEAGKLLHDKATFKYIRWFLNVAPTGSITTPDGWYVRYEPGCIERWKVRFGLAGW
jgi:hypothetical protein